MGANYHNLYSKALFPDIARVFGKRLGSVVDGRWQDGLTLGQALLLCRDGNPLVNGGEVELWHLVRAIYVCSRNCWEGAAGLQRSSTLLLLKLWKWQIGLRCTRAEIEGAIKFCSEWLENSYERHKAGPPKWEGDPTKARKLHTPFLLLLKARLMSYFAMPARNALECRIQEALWDTEAILEERQQSDWVSADEFGAIEERAFAS